MHAQDRACSKHRHCISGYTDLGVLHSCHPSFLQLWQPCPIILWVNDQCKDFVQAHGVPGRMDVHPPDQIDACAVFLPPGQRLVLPSTRGSSGDISSTSHCFSNYPVQLSLPGWTQNYATPGFININLSLPGPGNKDLS